MQTDQSKTVGTAAVGSTRLLASIFGLYATNSMPTVAMLRYEQMFEDEDHAIAAATVEARMAEQTGRHYDAILIVKMDDTMLVRSPAELLANDKVRDEHRK